MKTTARSIAQTTKYRTPSVWNPMAAVRHREESWFYFPEPSMVFKKEEEGEEQDSQMFSLLFQLLNYDFSSKNQYFIKLEMQPLLQELKVIMTTGAREEKTILEKINQMLQEVLHLREVHENATFWLSHVETMKQEASVLLERLVKKQSVPHSSPQVSQNTMYQLRNWALQPVTQIQTNINQKITSYENRLHKELHSSEKVLMTEHWRNDVHHLRTIYERMSKEEKESFLQEISVTEREFLSTQNMTREQWEVFLAKSLPLITVYAKKQDEKEQAVQQQKEILKYVTDFTEVQWQNLKLILMQNVHGEYVNLHSYFNGEKQENHDVHENWMQEKQNFVDYIQKNEYVSLLNSFLLNAEIINNTAFLAEKEKNAEAEKISPPEKSGENLTDWIFHLTKNQWQEVNNLFDSLVESYTTPQLQSVQMKPSAEQLILTEEMQRIQKFILKNRVYGSESMEVKRTSVPALQEYWAINGQQMNVNERSIEHWQHEVQHLHSIYRSMDAKEKEIFLRELSVTESELLSVQKMTKAQWEVFLTHTLPAISSFVRKQEQVQTTKETAYQKEFLHQLEKFVEIQREKSNLTRSQNEHTDIRNLRVISDLKSQETNSVFHHEMNQSLSFNGFGRRMEEIFLEPIGLYSKNRNYLENRKIYRFDRTIDTLMTRQRQRDLHQFVDIYESREAEQKEVILQELENIQHKNLQATSVSNGQFSLWDVYAFSRTTNQTISELLRNRMMENHQISLFQKVSSHFTTEHWQKHLRQFYQIYESMEVAEKTHFLETLSMTEAEMVSVRNMTKDQWEVFLTNVMPLISSYIQKQEETDVTKSTVHEKEFLRQMKELEKVYEENLKSTSVSNEQSSLRDVHAFSRTTNQTVSELLRNRMMENHQISLLQKASATLTTERWQRNLRQFYQIYETMEVEEKSRFLEAISMTEAEMVSVRNMTKDQWEVFQTNVMPLISSYVKQQEEIQKTQKLLQEKEFLRYVSELNETKWQEFKSILLSTQQTALQSIRSFFEEIQQENRVFVQNVTEEKQAFTEYVEKHQYVSLLRSILTDFIKSEQKETVFETKEEKRYSEETLRETTEKLAEWVSYLTETQWQEIRDVFTENVENTIVRPVLEMMEQQKPAHDEPSFSAEKRGLISYLAEHIDASVEIIRLIESKESLKNSMEPWVTLPAEEKISEENVVLQEFEQTFTDEQIQDTAESLTEWISYLTENQWQEIKSVLTVHQNEAYISPLLEMVKQQEPFEMEPEFSAEKRGAMIFISQNKQASAGLIKILMNQQTIEKNLSDWVDLTPWKTAQEKSIKTTETAEASHLPEESAKNSIDVLTKFMSVLTESQWRELRETAVNQHQYRHLQPLLTLSKTQEEHISFEAEKQTWIDHITENQAAVSEFLNLIQENRKVNLVFQNVRQKGEMESNITYEKPFMTQVSLRIAEEQKRAAAQMTVQQIQNWLQQTESVQSGNSAQTLRSDADSQTVFLQNQTVSHYLPGILQRSKATGTSAPVFNQQGNMQNQIMHNGTLLQTVHHFSGVMNQDTPENALLQPDSYGTAQMVVVKKTQGNAMVQTPPKIPEVILEAKKAMQTEVHDIITRKRSQEPEPADNKTVMELIRRLDVQQKEIEKIRSTQKQTLNITDISVVTEKVMNQMQSQLRLEKMRRGL